MGMIADELEQKLIPLHGLLGSHLLLPVNSAGLSTPLGGPVVGTAFVQTDQLVGLLTEISKALKHIPATIKKLEDKIRMLETMNPATGRPMPPPGFRK